MGRDAPREVAKALSAVTNIPLDIQTVAPTALVRGGPITDDIIATQQGVAGSLLQAWPHSKTGRVPRRGLEAGQT